MTNDSLMQSWGKPQMAAWRRTYPQEARLLKLLLRERLTRAAERSPSARAGDSASRRFVTIQPLAQSPLTQRALVVH